MTNGDKLNALFRLLRREGLVARQNHLCCGGCAAASIGEMARARGLRGGVYYHQQDAEALRPTNVWGVRTRKLGDEVVRLGFGAADGEGEKRDALTVEIGETICKAAARVGLATRWNGSAHERIQVLLPGGIDAEARASLFFLRLEAQKADDAFGDALRSEYGPQAGDARYWGTSVHPAHIRKLATAKLAADEAVRIAIEEGIQ